MFKPFAIICSIVLAGCSPAHQPVQKGGTFINVGQSSFAVFTQDGGVTAILMGDDRPQSTTVFAKLALKAISYATRCGIEQGSLRTDGKSLNGLLDCTVKTVFLGKRVETGHNVGTKWLPEISEIDQFYLGADEGDILETGQP